MFDSLPLRGNLLIENLDDHKKSSVGVTCDIKCKERQTGRSYGAKNQNLHPFY